MKYCPKTFRGLIAGLFLYPILEVFSFGAIQNYLLKTDSLPIGLQIVHGFLLISIPVYWIIGYIYFLAYKLSHR